VAFAGTRAHWYLMAWCRLRDGARAFRLDRIRAAVDTGEPAPQRSYADLDVDIPDALRPTGRPRGLTRPRRGLMAKDPEGAGNTDRGVSRVCGRVQSRHVAH
jgi:hypothetical protein